MRKSNCSTDNVLTTINPHAKEFIPNCEKIVSKSNDNLPKIPDGISTPESTQFCIPKDVHRYQIFVKNTVSILNPFADTFAPLYLVERYQLNPYANVFSTEQESLAGGINSIDNISIGQISSIS